MCAGTGDPHETNINLAYNKTKEPSDEHKNLTKSQPFGMLMLIRYSMKCNNESLIFRTKSFLTCLL